MIKFISKPSSLSWIPTPRVCDTLHSLASIFFHHHLLLTSTLVVVVIIFFFEMDQATEGEENVMVTPASVSLTTTSPSSSSPASPASPSLSPPPSSPYYTFKLTDLSRPLLRSLNAGASSRRRLRYTCSDVSPNVTPVLEAPARYLALGTTSGSVHVFRYFAGGRPSGTTRSSSSSPPPVIPPSPGYQNPDYPPQVNGGCYGAEENILQTLPTTSTSVQHYLTIIHEELIGPVTSVAFAPVQLVVHSQCKPPSDGEKNANRSSNGFSSSSSSSGSDDSGGSSDLDSTSSSFPPTSGDQLSSVVYGNGYGSNHQRSSPLINGVGTTSTSSTTTPTTTHSLYNLVLAIGSSKGSLLIVDIDLHQPKSTKLSSSSSASFFSNHAYHHGSSSVPRKWAVTYQSNRFTSGQAISLLRWDNSSRY